MRSIGFTEVSLDSVLDSFAKNNLTEAVTQLISTSHITEFAFSPEFVIKRTGANEEEFNFYHALLNAVEGHALHALRQFAPKVYGLIWAEDSDAKFIVMENFAGASTQMSQLDVKLGFFNFTPSNHLAKQTSKLDSSFRLRSIDNGFRVCMYQRRDVHGVQLLHQKAVKRPVPHFLGPDDLELFFALRDNEKDKQLFLTAALQYYVAQLAALEELFRLRQKEMGYFVSAASVIFLIDYAHETYRLVFYDFGQTHHCKNTELWTEQADAFAKLIEHVKNIQAKLSSKLIG